MLNIQHFLPEAPELAKRLQSCLLELKDIMDESARLRKYSARPGSG